MGNDNKERDRSDDPENEGSDSRFSFRSINSVKMIEPTRAISPAENIQEKESYELWENFHEPKQNPKAETQPETKTNQ